MASQEKRGDRLSQRNLSYPVPYKTENDRTGDMTVEF
jgi:hypothetical protein